MLPLILLIALISNRSAGSPLHQEEFELVTDTEFENVTIFYAPGNVKPLLCTSRKGRFPDPYDCSRYIECDDGVGTVFVCPEGQLFNSGTNVCESAIFPTCKDRDFFCPYSAATMEAAARAAEAEVMEKYVLPYSGNPLAMSSRRTISGNIYGLAASLTSDATFHCPTNNGRWAVIDDCQQFHICIRGEAFQGTCEGTLRFDAVTRKCVSRRIARCMAAAPTCTTDGIFQLGDFCDRYVVCCNGASIVQYCKNGFVFDVNLFRCTMSTLATCPE